MTMGEAHAGEPPDRSPTPRISPKAFLLGADGPELRMPGRIAFDLAGPLTRLVSEVRRNGGRVHPHIDGFLEALQTVAEGYVARTQDPMTASVGGNAEGVVAEAMASSRASDLVDAKEAAEMLAVSARRIRQLRADGDLPAASRAGRQWLFDRRAVVDLAEERSVGDHQD